MSGQIMQYMHQKQHFECATWNTLAELVPIPSGKVEKFDITLSNIWAKLEALSAILSCYHKLTTISD